MSQNYGELLSFVRTCHPYNTWKPSTHSPHNPRFRDYSSEANPSVELSRFGLYDFKDQKIIKSLHTLARECQAPASLLSSVSKPSRRRTTLLSPGNESLGHVGEEQKKKQARIIKTLSDKEKWKRDHAPIILKYFAGVRGIPREWVSPWVYYAAGMTVQRYTVQQGENAGEQVCEIVIPLWASDGGLVQVMKIQVDPETGQKKAKKLLLAGDRDRAIMLGAVESDRVMVVEGIEDGLSILAALTWHGVTVGELPKKQACNWAICVSCGASALSKTWELIQNYEHRVVILDRDRPTKMDTAIGPNPASGSVSESSSVSNGGMANILTGHSCRGSLGLGDRVLRYLPPSGNGTSNEGSGGDVSGAGVSGSGSTKALDANAVLQSGGVEAVWEWLEKTSRPENFIAPDEIKLAGESEEEAALADAESDSFEYHKVHNPLSEQAAAKFFVGRFGKKVRLTEDKRWWVWNGQVWNEEHAEAKCMSNVASLDALYRRLAHKAQREGKSEDYVNAMQNFGASLGSASRQSNILRCSRGAGELQTKVDRFDSETHIINTPSGIVNLRTGELSRPNPDSLCSKITAVKFRPDLLPSDIGVAGCRSKAWQGYLTHASGGREEWLEFFQMALGYALTGETKEKCLFFAWGLPDAGKTTFSEVLMKIMGGGYSSVVNIAVLLDSGNSYNINTMDYKRAALAGVRALFTSETSAKQKLSPDTIKNLTGNDRLTGRFPGGKEFSFEPRGKIWIRGNNPPAINDADKAVFNRLRVLDFSNPFAGAEKDQGFMSRLLESTEELEAIFAWCVRGAVEWYRTGLPAFTSEPTEELLALYRESSPDAIIEGFIENCCGYEKDAYTTASECRRTFLSYLDKNSLEDPGEKAFYLAIKPLLIQKGFPHVRPHNKSTYKHLRLLDPDFDFAPVGNSKDDEDDDLIH